IIKGLATATILSSFAVPTASFAAEKDNSPVEVQQQAETKHTGWKVINGKRFFIQKDGSVAKTKGTFHPEGGGVYLLEDDGSLSLNDLKDADGKDLLDVSTKNGWKVLTYDGAKKKEKFYLKDGSFQIGFQKIDGKTYYFHQDGALHTKAGLQDINGKTYFFEEDGTIDPSERLQEKDGKTYYFNGDGSIRKDTGVVKAWYKGSIVMWGYADENGAFDTTLSGIQEINGKKYYFGSDGMSRMTSQDTVSGPDGTKLYVNEDASLYNGWKEVNGKKYYIEDGKPHIWTLKQDGKQYYFNEDGSMHTGWLTWNSDQTKSYFNEDGAMIKNETKEIDGKTYQFDQDGIAQVVEK
ncbi:hypothetical protein, partial [Bacillus sp. 196mf]|uniref:N-acetylmuramoyl-L-alanine amidase family protein n=1 Tax=Bacillus sp. 196mf TaxID=1761754 RepID=UPI000DA0B37D